MNRPSPSSPIWPATAAGTAALIALLTMRSGITPHSDGVSYWSAAREVNRGHFTSSGLIPAFSDLDLRSIIESGRAPFVDFPIGYPWLVGILAFAVGVIGAQFVVEVAATAAIAALIVRGPSRPESFRQLIVRSLCAWVAIGVPIAVQVRQGGLPEPPFAAGLLLFCIVAARLRRTRSTADLMWLAALGGSIGLLRFVGLPLVVIVVVEGIRSTGSRCRAAIAGVMCALPGLVNAVLANRVTGRQIHIMDRGWIDLKFAGTSFAGWFISWNTTVSDILDAGWHTPLPFYAIAFATSAVIVLGVARWVRNRNPSDATLPLAVAGALFGALIITMIMYDALAKFEPRMLYPAGVMVIASFAWTRVPIQQHTIRVMVAAAWVVIAASPTTWGAPRFDADPVRSQILTDAGARVVIGNAADLAHYQTGIPAAYFPTATYIHSGIARDRDDVMTDLPCRLRQADGVVLLDPAGFPDGWAIDVLERQLNEGRWERTTTAGYTLYTPSDGACAPD